MKKLLFPVLALAAIAAGVVLFAGATAASTPTPRTVTYHLLERSLTFAYQDNAPKGTPFERVSAGDSFEFTSALVTKTGKRAGTVRGHCVFVSGGKGDTAASICNGTFGLAGGELEAQTAQRGDARVTRIAIVGGTGMYEGATGSVTSIGESNGPNRDIFHVVLP